MQRFLKETMEAAEVAGGRQGQQYSEAGNAHYVAAQYGFQADANDFTNIDQTLGMSTNPAIGKGDHDPNIGSYLTMPVQNGHVDVLGPGSNITASRLNVSTSTTPYTPGTKRKSLEDVMEVTPLGGDSKRRRSKVSRACDQCRKKKVNKQLLTAQHNKLTSLRCDATQTTGRDS